MPILTVPSYAFNGLEAALEGTRGVLSDNMPTFIQLSRQKLETGDSVLYCIILFRC